jgi:hypothetical protein
MGNNDDEEANWFHISGSHKDPSQRFVFKRRSLAHAVCLPPSPPLSEFLWGLLQLCEC